MKNIAHLTWFLAVLGAGSSAIASETSYSSVEVSTERQRLSNGSSDWTEHTLRWRHNFDQRRLLEIAFVDAHRFGLQDDQTLVTAATPLHSKLGLTIDLSQSSTHRFLPRDSSGAMLQYEFAPGWLIHGGAKNTRYDLTTVEQSTLMLEQYVGNFSWAAAWRPTRAFNTDVSNRELRGNYYYGDRRMVGLGWADGQEVVSSDGRSLTLAHTYALTLQGRHRLDRSWDLIYSLSSNRFGNFYNREGLRIGLQRLF